MPWFGKWVRPLAWGVLEQGHAALVRLAAMVGENGRGGGPDHTLSSGVWGILFPPNWNPSCPEHETLRQL